MATAAVDGAQDSLSCGVCFERYNTSTHLPKGLPCLHTFCNSCIDSLAIEGGDVFECPVCQSKTFSEDVRTNLAVRDIIEELHAKQSTKVFCSDHPGKECSMVCTDCCQPLCTVCVKGLRKGVHKDHEIDDIEDARVYMKKHLSTMLDEKITALESASAAEVDRLMQESENHAKNVEVIVHKITEALEAWKEDQLQSRQRRTQQAVNKHSEKLSSLKASLIEKLNRSDFQEIASAQKEIESKSIPEIEKINISNIQLQQENLDELQDKLCSIWDTMRASVKEGTLALTPLNISDTSVKQKLPQELPDNMCKSEPVCSAILEDSSIPVKESKTSQTDQSEPEVSIGSSAACSKLAQTLQAATAPSQAAVGNSICPACNANIPLYLENKAHLYNLARNNEFFKVVHDRRKKKDTLLCRTDDFIVSLPRNKRELFFITGLWQQHAIDELIPCFEKWHDVSNAYAYVEDLEYAESGWKQALSDMRSGEFEIDWD